MLINCLQWFKVSLLPFHQSLAVLDNTQLRPNNNNK